MRFVCAGDLHLGSGPDLHPDGAKARLLEQERVLGQIVDAANELEAPLLWVGDAWEHRRPTPAQVLAFRRPLQRLEHGGILIPGNHDVEAFEEPTGYDLVDRWAITTPQALHFHANKDGGSYQLACLPWAPPHRLVPLDETGDRDRIHERLAEGLLEIARGLYAEMTSKGGPRILIGHWSISGAGLPSGLPTDQLREPVIPLDELAAIGYDAVVFGHIHRPQLLTPAGIGSPIFYVGSPMPLNFGETTTDHCCWLLDTDAGAYQLPLDYPPLQTIDTEALELPNGAVEAAHREVTAGATVKLRVEATESEARRLDLAQIKAATLQAGARHVWSIQLEVDRPELQRGATVDEGLDDLETFGRWLDEQTYTLEDGGQADGFLGRITDRHAAIVEGRR